MSEPRELSCAECFKHLDDFVDRELTAADLEAVEQHLQACGDCSGEFETERELLEAIRAKLAQVRMPPDLMAKISARLSRE